MIGYHGDRDDALQNVKVVKLREEINSDYDKVLLSLFQNGLSGHGEYNLTNSVSPFMFQEIVFDYVRLAKFPLMYSRLQSFFAVETLETMNKAYSIYLKSNDPYKAVYKVEGNVAHALDMNWVHMNDRVYHCSIDEILYRAEKYWSGKKTAQPDVELLMVPPVKILCRMKIVNDKIVDN